MKEQLAAIGMTALKALLPIFAAALTLLIKEGAALLKAHTKNTKTQGMIDRLDGLLETTVQETVHTSLAVLPDNPTVDDLTKARSAALASLKTHLGAKGIDELKTVLGWDDASIDQILSSYIAAKFNAQVYMGSVTIKKEGAK